jgi:hypothetical protein
VGDSSGTGGLWSRPVDDALYADAVRRLYSDDAVVRAYVRHQYTTRLEKDLTAQFLTPQVVGEVLASGFREFYDYQDAVEQRDRVAGWHHRRKLSPARLMSWLRLVALQRQVDFMRRQWEKS